MDVQNIDSGARSESMLERTVPADMAAMPDLVAFLEGALETMGCPLAITTKLMVCLDEIASNIVNYSNAKNIEVRFEYDPNSRAARLTIADDGEEFDPLAHEDPAVNLAAEEREIGGLGIFMVKKLMDKVVYSRENGKNVVIMEKMPF